MSDELHYLSATEAIAHFRARELSPVELLKAIIDRTQKLEPHINAFTEEMFDEALAAPGMPRAGIAAKDPTRGRWREFR